MFSTFVALVISAVILAVLAAMAFVLLVMLAVFEAIAFVLLVMLEVLAAIAFILLVILTVFDIIFVSNAFSAFVALVISAVILAVFVAIDVVLLVILDVLEAIKVGNVDIVEEFIPPTLFTVGKLAVPPKSFVSFNIPLTLDVASGAPDPPTNAATKAVVASCVVLVPGAAVGAVGVPVNEGEAIGARNNISAVLDVILKVFETIAFVLLVILAVFAAIEIVLLVILAVFDVIKVGNVAIVEALKPPTLVTVVEKVPNPAPATSPVKAIN